MGYIICEYKKMRFLCYKFPHTFWSFIYNFSLQLSHRAIYVILCDIDFWLVCLFPINSHKQSMHNIYPESTKTRIAFAIASSCRWDVSHWHVPLHFNLKRCEMMCTILLLLERYGQNYSWILIVLASLPSLWCFGLKNKWKLVQTLAYLCLSENFIVRCNSDKAEIHFS